MSCNRAWLSEKLKLSDAEPGSDAELVDAGRL